MSPFGGLCDLFRQKRQINIDKNIPGGRLYSRADWFSSMLKARQVSDRILPSHDPLLFKKKPAVFP